MIKVIELFAGIGACSKALERLGIEHQIVDAVEIDKYAIKSFNAIHGTNFEPQDITKWDKDLECDLIMHGSPCQDFSAAGKQAGGDEGSGTRSSLMYETIRIVKKLKPKYVVWENVKNILSKKHRHNFEAYLKSMEELGYKNYYQVLNAKDYGVPQNRERVFTISVLGGGDFEFPKGEKCNNKVIECNKNWKHQQDLIQDENGLCRCIPAGTHGSTPHLLKTVVNNFEFPEPLSLDKKLKDMLEEDVPDKYYLSDRMINYVLDLNGTQKGTKWEGRADNDVISPDVAHTISVRGAGGSQRAGVSNFISPYHNNIKVKDLKRLTDAKEPTIVASRGRGENNEQQLEPRKDGNTNTITSVQKDNYVALPGAYGRDFGSKGKVEDIDGNVGTLQAAMGCGGGNVPLVVPKCRIRKLTPKECYRLMGFDDIDYEKAKLVNSDTQLYKQAGNSIVVNVLENIFKNLLKG